MGGIVLIIYLFGLKKVCFLFVDKKGKWNAINSIMPNHCAGTSLVLGNCAPHVEKKKLPLLLLYSKKKKKLKKKKKKKTTGPFGLREIKESRVE